MEQKRKVELSIEQWLELTKEGVVLPVHITLNGDSMRPLIRKGKERVTILPVTRPLMIGDIVLFHDIANDRYVVHRVFRMENDKIQTLGDFCVHPDRWMGKSQVYGIVTEIHYRTRCFSTDSKFSRAFGCVWMAIRPVRPMYIGIHRVIRLILRRCFGGR